MGCWAGGVWDAPLDATKHKTAIETAKRTDGLLFLYSSSIRECRPIGKSGDNM
jgi:hypothetical protein